MALVILPYMYVPDPTRGRPVFNGKIYIGEVDTDPRIESNQKAALLVQEDGSRVEAEYPIQINSGGVPTYNGSPVAIDVTGEYAIAIDSKDDQQVYYFARAGTDAENLTTDLRSVMFDFGMLYSDIGSALVPSTVGTSLDDARLILDINSGRVLDLPTSIPAGSVVVSLTDFTLVTNNGQFALNQAWSNTVENRIKGQQNWNIPDPSGDPLISSTPTTYSVGEFPAVNVEVVNANAVNLRRVGDLVIGDSGTLRHYARGAYRAGVIDETTEYMGIKDHTGAQLEVGVVTGVTKGNNGTDLYVDVDITQFPNGYRFAGISAERGLWVEVSDNDQAIFDLAMRNRSVKAVTRITDQTYTNDTLSDIEVSVTVGQVGNSRAALLVDGVVFSKQTGNPIGGVAASVNVTATVPVGSTYRLTSLIGNIEAWVELRNG